jgi:hypothetical protein
MPCPNSPHPVDLQCQMCGFYFNMPDGQTYPDVICNDCLRSTARQAFYCRGCGAILDPNPDPMIDLSGTGRYCSSECSVEDCEWRN